MVDSEFDPRELEARRAFLLEVYQDPNFITLYRYDTPSAPYDDRREGVTSKREIIGEWFDSSPKQLAAYIHMRSPGGNIITVRIESKKLPQYEAANIEAVQNMDREQSNYIIPAEEQSKTKLTIPLGIHSTNPKKFLMKDWPKIDEFVARNTTPEKLIEYIKSAKKL